MVHRVVPVELQLAAATGHRHVTDVAHEIVDVQDLAVLDLNGALVDERGVDGDGVAPLLAGIDGLHHRGSRQ